MHSVHACSKLLTMCGWNALVFWMTRSCKGAQRCMISNTRMTRRITFLSAPSRMARDAREHPWHILHPTCPYFGWTPASKKFKTSTRVLPQQMPLSRLWKISWHNVNPGYKGMSSYTSFVACVQHITFLECTWTRWPNSTQVFLFPCISTSPNNETRALQVSQRCLARAAANSYGIWPK